MDKHWIVVAADGQARIFESRGRNGHLEEIFDLANPTARLPAHSIDAQAPGRSFDRVGSGRHAMEPRSERRAIARERFAAEIAETLRGGWQEGRFDNLYVIAEPKMLGVLRDILDPTLRKHLAGEVPGNLVTEPVDTIRAHLPDFL